MRYFSTDQRANEPTNKELEKNEFLQNIAVNVCFEAICVFLRWSPVSSSTCQSTRPLNFQSFPILSMKSSSSSSVSWIYREYLTYPILSIKWSSSSSSVSWSQSLQPSQRPRVDLLFYWISRVTLSNARIVAENVAFIRGLLVYFFLQIILSYHLDKCYFLSEPNRFIYFFK